MDDDDLRLLSDAGTETAAPAGCVVIERGQIGSGLYVILEGSVVVEAPEGTRSVGAGAVIGERALLSADGTRTARVRAASDVRLLAVERAEFDRLCARDAGLAARIGDAAS
jgi:CRP-like cAMP-binding protein